jgi:hypothetical protein
MGIILYYYFLKTKVGHNLCYPEVPMGRERMLSGAHVDS